MNNETSNTPTQKSFHFNTPDEGQVCEVLAFDYSKRTSITKLVADINVSSLNSEEREVIYELARSIALDDIARIGPKLSSPESAYEYVRTVMMGLEHEVFAIVFIDNQHSVIEYRELFQGTVDSAAVYPREVAKAALKANASRCFIAHNHPSSSTDPSQADKDITHRIETALSTVDISLLDHIIVSKSGSYSFAEHGLI